MTRILLTHTPEMFRNYYGERALARLRELGEVRLHRDEHPLAGEALVAAAHGCEIVVSDFKTPGDAPVFEKSPQLVAFLRCAVDIRTIDVAAASRAGVLVTRASPGFVPAVTELVLGLLVDLSRGNLVDEAALARALDSGRLAGCAIDVGRAEVQMPNPAIAARPDVIATPHLGGLTPQAIEHQAFETVVQGRSPKGAVNPRHATRLARLAKTSPRREA